MAEKINVGILCGGKSAEHQISLLSVQNVLRAIDREKYTPIIIGIEKEGMWRLCNEETYLLHPSNPIKISLNTYGAPVVTFLPGGKGRMIFPHIQGRELMVDVVFPILHGPYGEDGSVQGFLEISGVPYVGSRVKTSAICMDKEISKGILTFDDFNPENGCWDIDDFGSFTDAGEHIPFGKAKAMLDLPFFVKPAQMGSSIGVSRVHNEGEYKQAVTEALKYDSKILLEKMIVGRELEVAVLENKKGLLASVPGEVITPDGFYSYDEKYLEESKTTTVIPADLDEETTENAQKMAKNIFRLLECKGLARVDMFLDEEGNLLFNEINTMPGFTDISMYPKLMEHMGVSPTDLVNELLQFTLQS